MSKKVKSNISEAVTVSGVTFVSGSYQPAEAETWADVEDGVYSRSYVTVHVGPKKVNRVLGINRKLSGQVAKKYSTSVQ
ncbi:hypothetical protein [uncultured Maritimibacter sp.]|uniref:hypothetical protein n=1 Tax=uncultured Maritimibacter sp. TaxID=991866 RepID=UPI0025963215|nr:hypothetical protein [uncultured Maritimibacter sp.]